LSTLYSIDEQGLKKFRQDLEEAIENFQGFQETPGLSIHESGSNFNSNRNFMNNDDDQVFLNLSELPELQRNEDIIVISDDDPIAIDNPVTIDFNNNRARRNLHSSIDNRIETQNSHDQYNSISSSANHSLFINTTGDDYEIREVESRVERRSNSKKRGMNSNNCNRSKRK